MFKLYLTSILVAEVVAVVALASLGPGGVRLWYLVPIITLTLVVAFIARRRFGGPTYGVHRLSPQAIAGYRAREPATNSPEALSRAIVERAEEIQHALEAPPKPQEGDRCPLRSQEGPTAGRPAYRAAREIAIQHATASARQHFSRAHLPDLLRCYTATISCTSGTSRLMRLSIA
jgi:hypothetical protein